MGTIREDVVAKLVPDLLSYRRKPDSKFWGSLSAIYRDGDYSDNAVRHCVDWAKLKKDWEAQAIAVKLFQLEDDERRALGRLVRQQVRVE